MWSVWLVFCDCGFHSVCPLTDKDKKLPDLREGLWGKLGLVMMGGAILSRLLIQLSVDEQDCVPSLSFDLRPNYGGGTEDNGEVLQKAPCMHCSIQSAQSCSRLPLIHTSAKDSWTLTGKSESVSCGVTAPFSWVLVCTRFCLCPPKVCFQSPVSSGGSLVGLMVISPRRLMPNPCLLHPEPLHHGRPLLTSTCAGDTQTLKSRSASASVGSSGVQEILFMPSKCLWPVWGLILNAISPLLPSCWSFSFAYGCGVSFLGEIQHSLFNGCSAVSCNFGVLT